MFKKTMTFDDLDGNEVQQTFYFNLTKKEIAELLEFGQIMRFAKPGDVRDPIEKQLEKLSTPIEESGLDQRANNQQAYDIFQSLLLDAYGVKGADNVSFDKSEELRHYFSTHVAFPELIFEFLENPREGAEFIESCMPTKMVEAAKKEMVREGGGKMSESSLAAMVEEASRRQQDPATRIEPGPEAAAAALGDNPVINDLARSVAQEAPTPVAKKVEDYTEADLLNMPQEEFLKIDPRKLTPEQMNIAFRRKFSS